VNVYLIATKADSLIPEGHIYASEQLLLQAGETPVIPVITYARVELIQDGDVTQVDGKGFSITFDKKSGQPTEYLYKGINYLVQSPQPAFWRAPTDNDFGNHMPKRCEIWRQLSQNTVADSFNISQINEGTVKSSAIYKFNEVNSSVKIDYTIFGSGDIVTDYEFIPDPVKPKEHNYQLPAPEWGGMFSFSKNDPVMIKLQPLGKGLTNAFTVEIKFIIDQFNDRSVLWDAEEWEANCLHLELHNSTLYFFMPGVEYVGFNYKFETGKWYHINVVYDAVAKTVVLYVNGKSEETFNFKETVPFDLTDNSFIGAYTDGGRYLYGKIDFFRVWDEALSTETITDLEKNCPLPNAKGLIEWLDMDEIHGTKVLDRSDANKHAEAIELSSTLPEIPRIGMFFRLPGTYGNLNWYGRGPHENYQDRKTSAFVGEYKSTVDEQYTPYIRPQENGYKTDTRWLTLTDDLGNGWLFEGMSEISFSALPFDLAQLDYSQSKNRHTDDLKPSGFTDLFIDYRQMGVGGDDSWGAYPYPQYMLPVGHYKYAFHMRPFAGKKEKPELLLFRTMKEK
jgi:hypothetical protein